MMWSKAVLFKDTEIVSKNILSVVFVIQHVAKAEEILTTSKPAAVKALGRKVSCVRV
jgi:hypothetical protein